MTYLDIWTGLSTSRRVYRADGLVIPEPPVLCLRPNSKRAIVTVAVGSESKACLEASGPCMEAYAKKYNADFVILNWPGHPRWPMSSKFAIPRVLEHYERIAYVDADVLLRKTAISLFDSCAEDEIGLCDELPWHRIQPQYRREQEYISFRKLMGYKDVQNLPFMFNCGVMVVPKYCGYLLAAPKGLLPIYHCAEQDNTSSQILDAFLDGDIKLRMLDRRCNWQDWTDYGHKSATIDAILHWSGAWSGRPTRAQRIAQMSKG